MKQLSTQILINLGLCCCMGSGKAWQKSNAATGIEGNMKREGALHYEHRFPASPAHIPGHRFYMDCLCSCTTPQQLFSHKPPSRHGNANNCRLAREELALVTCKTWQSITKMGKQCNIMDPCLHIISNFFPRNIYSYTLLHTDCNWAAILRAVRISHIGTPKLSHFMPKKSMKKKNLRPKCNPASLYSWYRLRPKGLQTLYCWALNSCSPQPPKQSLHFLPALLSSTSTQALKDNPV